MKFYAVKTGRQSGVYTSWDDCKKQVNGFKGAVFKSFVSRNEADAFINTKTIEKKIEHNSVYFDGGCRGGCAGGACYIPHQSVVYYQRALSDPETKKETNNRGELTGLILALKHTKEDIVVYGDSLYAIKIGAREWVNKNNDDLVKVVHELAKNRRIVWNHVPAHSGNFGNEICDQYSTKALKLEDRIEHKQILEPAPR